MIEDHSWCFRVSDGLILNNKYALRGNVRLSYTDTSKDGIIQPRSYMVQQCDGPFDPFNMPNCIDYWKPGEIVEINNYYPFGLLHNYTTTTQNAYQYKYNGKELQETGMYDYGARMYMPDLVRWGVVDPLSEKMRRYSPYNYAFNNPIRYIDPDGRGPLDIIYFNINGKEVKRIKQDGADVKKMVLSASKKEGDINSAIEKGHVVSAFSNSEGEKMAEIYKFGQSDKTRTEKGFIRGDKGESKVVTGTKQGEISSSQWADARKDLKDKGSTPLSDVHLHVNTYDEEGNIKKFGAPEGSPTDIEPKNNRGYTEPNTVLGYKQEITPVPAGQIGGAPTIDYIPRVGFYDTNTNPIITIDFSALQSTIKKINEK